MLLPLSECSRLTGLSRSALLKAISRGRVTAAKHPANGRWVIDSAELSRVYAIRSEGENGVTMNNTPSDAFHAERQRLESHILSLESERDYLRQALERESEQRAQLIRLLPSPQPVAEFPRISWTRVVLALVAVAVAGVAVWYVVRLQG